MMTVIEALVLHATGWLTEEQRGLYVEATGLLYRARAEIVAKAQLTPKPVQWVPQPEPRDE